MHFWFVEFDIFTKGVEEIIECKTIDKKKCLD